MAHILNFGSINIDHVYQVEHFVQPGETLSSRAYSKGLGGKGLNQTVALQRAGASVAHVGHIAADDGWLNKELVALQLNMDCIQGVAEATGHAIIQVNQEGENCILLYAGANHQMTASEINQYLDDAQVEWVLLQNETNAIEDIIRMAHARGKKIIFNPAPCHAGLANLPLEYVHTLVVNEVEAMQLSAMSDVEQALEFLSKKCKNVVLTLGGDGVRYQGESGELRVDAQKVEVVDTTAAGDTFIGYYLASLSKGMTVKASLERASQAAALTVTRLGAVVAIPFAHEVD
ncbi:ribokinase [Hydromonas duriensis]|uniref:Ribokinase n=1 Tax=Hydromonas duriensis TaxID=1527608 RepID=A0A4V3DK85_9BURK|nr:ribokinase [Hydromonas duriensis]TDR33110.1 ribokinase [Hydromonas duriensis]